MAGSHLNGHGHFVMVRGVGGIISAVSMAYLKNAFVLMAAMALGCSLTSKPGEKGGLSEALSTDQRIKPGMTRNQIERKLTKDREVTSRWAR